MGSIYEEDIEEARESARSSKVKLTVIGFVGTITKAKARPGKRPRRRPGQSPLDPVDPPRE
jgi:hypothetical protein